MKRLIRILAVLTVAALLLPVLTVSAGPIRYTIEQPNTETGSETPTPEGEAPGGETPAPGEETPTPGEETPTPGEETPTPEGNETPTPGEETPTPEGNETPTLNRTTPVPTKRPGIVSESTKDPYDESGRVTNAPPTVAPDVTVPPDLATPVPEQETMPPVQTSAISNDPAAGLIIVFGVLFLLLALDIAAILWRKNLGFSGLLNGGVARRKVDKSMESDEEHTEDDL